MGMSEVSLVKGTEKEGKHSKMSSQNTEVSSKELISKLEAGG